MAVTKSLIFANFTISNSTGGDSLTYENHETESAEVTITPITDQVGPGRTLPAGFDITASVRSLNTNVYSSSYVYGRNTAAEPVLGRIKFNGATGAQNIEIGPTIINVRRDYDGNRAGIVIELSERTTNVQSIVVES
jgi:hypothetical protein